MERYICLCSVEGNIEEIMPLFAPRLDKVRVADLIFNPGITWWQLYIDPRLEISRSCCS